LQALEPEVAGAPVLLIDELDRADEAFEAYLLEILSDFQVTIPEFGTVKAPQPPIVIITSNRTREIHDALKRRCLYHWVDYPSAERELAIVKTRVPGISAKLSQQVVRFVQALRDQDFYKSPGVAETIDWATALSELDAMNALQLIEIGNRADVYATLESIFVTRHEHALIFAQAFDLFFRAAEDWKHMLDSVPLPEHAKKKPPPASRRVQEALAQPM